MRARFPAVALLVLSLLLALPARGEEEAPPRRGAALFHAMVGNGAPDRVAARDALVPLLLIELPREAVFDTADRPALVDIRQALASDDPTVRILGAAAAARLGIDALRLREELVAKLADPSPPLRYWILEALRKLGPEAALAAPTLAKLVHECAEWGYPVRGTWTAGWPARDDANLVLAALVAIGPEALPPLEASFEGRDYTRPNAIEARAAVEARLGLPIPEPEGEPPAAPQLEANLPDLDVLLERMEAEADSGVAERDGTFETLYARGTAAVPALVYGVEHGSTTVRETCLEILAALGPAAFEATDFLFGLLASDDDEIRKHAVIALGASGAGDAAWVPTLIPFLDKQDTRVQGGAVRTLGAIGPAAAPARERLIELLLAPESDQPYPMEDVGSYAGLLRARCADALGRIGGPPALLVPALLAAAVRGGGWRLTFWGPGGWRGPSWQQPERATIEVREVALDAIGRLGLPALPVVRSSLTAQDAALRAMTTLALAEFPVEAVGATARHMALDPELVVREASIRALAKAAVADESSLRAIARLVSDTDRAILALGRLESAAEAAAPALVDVLLDGTPDRQRLALEALSKIRPDPETCFAPALAKAIESGRGPLPQLLWTLRTLRDGATGVLDRIVAATPALDEDSRLVLLSVMGDHDDDHPAQRACLLRLASDPSAEVRSVVARRVQHLGLHDAESVAAFAPWLDDPQIETATGIARAFAAAAPRVPEALVTIAPRIYDKRMRIRASAARALIDVERGEEAISTCLELLDVEDKHVRALGVVGIRDIGGVEAARPQLMDLWEVEKEHEVRFRLPAAIASTGQIGTDFVFAEHHRRRRDRRRHLIRNAIPYGGAHAVPTLRRWLTSGHIGTYYAGASMLGEIGEPARVAIPDLRRLADSGRNQALPAATEALFHVGASDEVLLPLIERCLADKDVSRAMGCRLLSKMGGRIEPILPAVERVFAYERFIDLRDALDALTELGADAVPLVPPLMAALPGHRATDRELIVRALARLAPHAPAAKRALLWALEDPWPECRLVAAKALLEHYGDDGEPVAQVATLLSDSETRVRRGVAEALSTLGEAAAPALPALLRGAESADRKVMHLSMLTLGGLESAADAVRPFLLRLAKGADPWRARAALAALGRLGGAPEVLDAVFREARASWDWRIRLGAPE